MATAQLLSPRTYTRINTKIQGPINLPKVDLFAQLNDLAGLLTNINYPDIHSLTSPRQLNHAFINNVETTILKQAEKHKSVITVEMLKFDELRKKLNLKKKLLTNEPSSNIYIKHLSNNIIKPSNTLMVNGSKAVGDDNVLQMLSEMDTQNNFYILLVGYGHNPNDKRMKRVDYNSLESEIGNNYDCDPFFGGSVARRTYKNYSFVETDKNAIIREGNEEIGKTLKQSYFNSCNSYTQGDVRYYFTSPKNYNQCKKHDYKENRKYTTKDIKNQKVKAVVYGTFAEMYNFLQGCNKHDDDESILYYSIMKLSELMKVQAKWRRGSNTIVKYRENGTMDITRENIFKVWVNQA
jgi:hypothetical protein